MIVTNMTQLAQARDKIMKAPEDHVLLIIRDMSTDTVEQINIASTSRRILGSTALDRYLQRVNEGIPLMVDTVKEYHTNY